MEFFEQIFNVFESQTMLSLLTRREIEIIKLVATGCTNRQIATHLFISEETVKKHLKNIFGKLAVSNRIGALRKVEWI
jgi:two-component system nitrate/nitrite response regulator NarP